MAYTQTRQHAHELIDQMAPGQVSAVVSLMEIMLDPLAQTLAAAAFDDEPVLGTVDSGAETELGQPGTIAHHEVLADFGLSAEDFARMGRTPLDLSRER